MTQSCSQRSIAERSLNEPTLSRTMHFEGEQTGSRQTGRARRQAGVGARVRIVEFGRSVQDWAPMKAAKSEFLRMDQRHEAAAGQLGLAPIADRDLGRAFHVDAAVIGRKAWTGSPSTAPPDSMPRMREHQPYSLKARVTLAAMA